MAVNATWTDPITCPFCECQLSSPGAGFVDHLEENSDCETEFDHWRSNLASDLAGGWSG